MVGVDVSPNSDSGEPEGDIMLIYGSLDWGAATTGCDPHVPFLQALARDCVITEISPPLPVPLLAQGGPVH